MTAATAPIQRPPDAKLLTLDRFRNIRHMERSGFASLLRSGDLVVANDAATLPASLKGQHRPTGEDIEVRLAARDSLSPEEVQHFTAVVFGRGDFRTRTEDRPAPPRLHAGDELNLGPLLATVSRVLHHPRFIELAFKGGPEHIWEGLSRHGRPIQYAHLQTPIDVWDTWSPIAGPPVAFEPPSAGFLLDWGTLAAIRARKVAFETITHAAGISSTGDSDLDAMLPFDEPYRIPDSVAEAIARARFQRGRIIAIGTTVVRALEHAAIDSGVVHAREGIATQRINAATRLRVVDAIVSGTHEPGTSHYDLLRAFTDDDTLQALDAELNAGNYQTHEFGDSVFIERTRVYFDSIAKPNIESPAPTTRYCMPSNS